MSEEDGGPAFGGITGDARGFDGVLGNVMVRDYFAAKAMQAIIIANPMNKVPAQNVANSENYIARSAFGYADAMLKERSK